MKIEIKEVNSDEIDLWLTWRMEVLSHVFPDMTSDEKNILTTANYNYFSKASKQKTHIATFALIDKKIVGTGDICLYQEMPSPDNLNGKCGYLMNIYTRKDFRRRGIASQIVKNLINKAKELEINKIYLEATEEAQNMYRHLGFCDMKGYLKLNEQ